MSVLRFVERNGRLILQQLVGPIDHWEDVPTVEELREPREFWVDKCQKHFVVYERPNEEIISAFIHCREVLP